MFWKHILGDLRVCKSYWTLLYALGGWGLRQCLNSDSPPLSPKSFSGMSPNDDKEGNGKGTFPRRLLLFGPPPPFRRLRRFLLIEKLPDFKGIRRRGGEEAIQQEQKRVGPKFGKGKKNKLLKFSAQLCIDHQKKNVKCIVGICVSFILRLLSPLK